LTTTPTRALVPYPGLRPFERHEADIFFGRETQVDAMVNRLAQHRLLAVTGSSGSGKSSLVYAGLLEALETGLLAAAGPVWRFATLHPGVRPMTELAEALLAAFGGPRAPDDVGLRRAALERGPLSLIEELQARPKSDGGNLLIVVDQFEELFRYQGLAGQEEAEAFVALLLASAGQILVPIYIVLTLRSDFLGRCAEFDELAEAVSDAQYLCPRLSRDQIRSAIEGPAAVFGGKVEPRLVARIVNDMGPDPDQLPLMQHALMRLWDLARARDPKTPKLRLDDYDREGGIRGSLSRHADEILGEVTQDVPERTQTARRLFCLLVEGEGESAVRRLARATEIIAVTGKPLDEIAAVADPFRAPGRSLLRPAWGRPLDQDTILDISHESLIRQWQTLKDWVRAEVTSGEQYRDIERPARRWAAGSGDFLDGVALAVALAWRDREHPAAAWAARYGSDFDLAMRFLDKSGGERDRLEAERIEQERRSIAAEEAVARQQEEIRRQQAEVEAEAARASAAEEAAARRQAEAEAAGERAVAADRLAEAEAARASAAEEAAARRQAEAETAQERAVAASLLAKRTRLGLVAMSLLLLVAVGLAWFGLVQAGEANRLRGLEQQRNAERNAALAAERDNAKKGWDEAATRGKLLDQTAKEVQTQLNRARLNLSRFLTEKARDAVRADQPETSILTALAALPHDMTAPDRSVWYPAVSVLADARSQDRLRFMLQGHRDSVRSAAFSPDGAQVVTASDDNTARLWDAKTGAALAALKGHTASVNSVAFSRDGKRVATASHDNTARIWDAKAGSLLAPLEGHEGSVNSAGFSPDGTWVVTASDDKTARLWDAKIGGALAVLKGHKGSVNSAAFSPDGRRVVTASDDDTARLWDARTGNSLATLKGHKDSVNSGAFSPDGKRVVTTSDDNTARLWDSKTGAALKVLQGHKDSVNSAAFSPDGKRVVTASDDNTARLWDATTGAPLAVLQGHTGPVRSAVFSPEAAQIVTASTDNAARLWDVKACLQGHTGSVPGIAFSREGVPIVTGSRGNEARARDPKTCAALAVLQGHTAAVTSAAFSFDGAQIVTSSMDEVARVWDAKAHAPPAVFQGHTDSVNSATFSPDRARVVTASDDKTARLWDAQTGSLLTVLQGHKDSVNSAAFSSDGTRVVTASDDNTARLWDGKTGVPESVLQGHKDSINSAAFSRDGKRVVTASDDQTARVWDVTTTRSLLVLSGHTDAVLQAAFSPDGTQIVTASADGTARLWNAQNGSQGPVLQEKTNVPRSGVRGDPERVYGASFSPDGASVVTASADKTAKLWDAANGNLLRTLEGHTGRVLGARFSKDGKLIVTTSSDKTARLWDPATGAIRVVLQGHTASVFDAVLNQDEARAVTASADGTARLWDVKTGASLAVLRGHTDAVHRAAFSPDGRRIVTASEDRTARLWAAWPLLTEDTIAFAEITAPRILSKNERSSLSLIETDADSDDPSAVAADSYPGAACDRLAANPLDPRKPKHLPGVAFGVVKAVSAVSACQAAMQAAPDEPRFAYQLWRALYRADRRNEATDHLRAAAEKGYPIAQYDLGRLYETGETDSDIVKDEVEALRLYRQAAEAGCTPAFSAVGRFYWAGIAVEKDHARAREWFERGAGQGDPFSHRQLAELYETGDGVPQDLEKALFHYAIATRLLEAARDEPDAIAPRARRGSLARVLAPNVAALVAREAAAWRPASSQTPVDGGSASAQRAG